jgi:predicted TIM-barrel fold metal-dependent hydrolase
VTSGGPPGAGPYQTHCAWRGLALFDAHLHIIDPRFPLVANQRFVPDPFDAGAYRQAIAGLPVTGGAVVAGSFQGFDTGWIAPTLTELGPGFVAVAQIRPETPDAEILALDAAGVRAVRFNLARGMAGDIADIPRLAARVHDLAGWHAEFYLESTQLADLAPKISGLPRVVIDHLGLTRQGLSDLLRLVRRGARVKATGFARLDFHPAAAIAAIHQEDPGALVFGTDLPGTRAPRPFDFDDLALIAATLPDPVGLRRVLADNARDLYGTAPGAAPLG